MIWIDFQLFGLIALTFWLLGVLAIYIFPGMKLSGSLLMSAGTIIMAVFLAVLWIQLERPPLRTLGETRLWYSVFLSAIGIVTYLRWKYKWFAALSILLAVLFLMINFLKPETYDKTLMPALQSPWFVPHVIVYILAYALLAGSSIVAAKGLYQYYSKSLYNSSVQLADNFVYLGFSFLTLGLIFGALWAKEAWGHYWTWDPKETWAFITWMAYLIYIHTRKYQPGNFVTSLWVLSLAFIILLVCWFGIKYLPTAQESIHNYSR